MEIDEIRLGTIVALAIIAVVFGITIISIEYQGSGGIKQGASVKTPSTVRVDSGSVHVSGDGMESYDNLNPEEVLTKRYEQSASDEIIRCLGNDGDDILPPLCDHTLDLLVQSCKDPISYVSACDDKRLLEYSADRIA
ncbi:MAG TPA: hypothetical protein VJP79_04275 [Nitrososphaera sp.]|nr:hypothetical protein [Nitrososphaera sp.]